MRLSIQRLRWVLVAGALLLVAVLAAYIGYGRYRALKAYRRILAHAGMTLTHDSNGVTWSQSVKGRKIVTVRAKTESSLGNNIYALHDAEVLLYTRSEEHPDHIYGSEMQYDQSSGVLRAKGDVFMDLQPPQGLTNGGRAPAQPDVNGAGPAEPARTNPKAAQIIHVRTSGLVYVRKLGIASTAQKVEFSYGGMQCAALGAEFNSSQSTLRLLADVHMDGVAHGQPLHVTATRADMDRNANIAHLTHPIATSGDRRASADTAILDLRKDGSMERVQGIDHVVLSSKTQKVTANYLDSTLTPQSVPETGRLSGDVVLVDTDPERPMRGSAHRVDAVFNAQGAPTRVVANGTARLSMVDHRTNARGLARSMDGAKISASFVPGKRRSSSLLKEIHAIGSAHAGGESVAPAVRNTVSGRTQPAPVKDVQVWADDLRILFTTTPAGRAQPQMLYGLGHTMLQQDAPLGEQETSRGDTLQMTFGAPSSTAATVPGKGTTNISSAVQNGHIVIHDRAATKTASAAPAAVSTGTADRAVYDGSTQQLTLSGDAHLYGDTASLIAPTVSIDQRTQDAEASGGVQATFQNDGSDTAHQARTSAAHARPEPLTHVLSASAHFEHASQLASFSGTDEQPARLWQGASQVEAATLLFDGAKRTFSARPNKSGTLIHAIFASNSNPPKPGASPHADNILRVASPKMDYNDLQREATFSGGVRIDGTPGEVTGQHAVVFLVAATPSARQQPNLQPAPLLQAKPSPLNGSIGRIVVYGSLQMDQPGRHGTGEQLLYTPASGIYVLTGTPAIPPRIVDAQKGSVTGATLLFTNAGSTIVVAGDSGAPKGKGGRVRSETHVRPAKEERQ